MTSLLQDARLNKIISRIPVFENIKSITPLHGGLTNSNYRVDTVKDVYMLRISDSTSSLLGINRENERVNTAKAYEAGIGAAVVDSLPEENVLVLSWINATTLHAEEIHLQPGLLPRMAASLRMLHAGQEFQGEFYFPAIRKKYLQTVIHNNYFIPDQYLEIDPLILELEKIIGQNPETFVPCNNDLLAENFMDDGKKIWIIDYEYSGQNEASFEIGNLANEIFLSEKELTVFCDAYWQKHLPGKIARANAWSIIARFGWVLWASIQEAISPVDFDFRIWGLRKWNSVLKELRGDHYQFVLENLKKYNS